MLKAFIERQKTAKFPYLGFHIWYMSMAGVRLPKNSFRRLFCIFVHQCVTFFVFTQFLQLYFTRHDAESIIENLKISLHSVVCIFKANTMLYWQHQWRDAVDYVTETDKFERLTKNIARGNIINRYTSQCSKITYYYIHLIAFTLVVIVTPGLLKYLTSASFRDGLHNGTEPFPHMFSAWTPYDDQQFPLNWITVAWQIFVSSVGAIGFLAFDLTAVAFMLFFGAEFEMLRLRSADLFEGPEPIGEEVFDQRIQLLHSLHTNLVKNIRLVRSLLSPVMFLYVLVWGLLLCVSTYLLTCTSTNASQKLMLIEYLVFGVTQLFIYCWMSNNVLEKSSLLAYGPYESAWWRGSRRQRRACLLLAGQMRGEHVFSAGPFTDLNLSTFVTILKGAYSYYTLLRN